MNKNMRLLTLAILCTSLLACAGMQNKGASTATQADIEALKKEQAALRKDVDQINKLLHPKPPELVTDVDLTIDISKAPGKGQSTAPLTLVEYTDYQCPFCGRHVKAVLPKILEEYVKTGKLQYVVRDFPLPFHPNALKAAIAAHCSAEQGKYWEMHEKLFANQSALGADKLPEYAKAAGMNVKKFQSCMDSGRYKDAVEASVAEAGKAGINGTPSFLVGFSQGGGKEVRAKKLIRGAVDHSVFKKTIDQLLGSGL